MKALLAVVLSLALFGCAVEARWGDASKDFSIYPISKAGGEIQVLTIEKLGVVIAGSDASAGGMPTIMLGYQKAQMTRVPSFPHGTCVPLVTVSEAINAQTGVAITNNLTTTPCPPLTPQGEP